MKYSKLHYYIYIYIYIYINFVIWCCQVSYYVSSLKFNVLLQFPPSFLTIYILFLYMQISYNQYPVSSWNHLTLYKQISSGSCQNFIFKISVYKLYLLYIYMWRKYMYKQDLALNNLQWLICHNPTN